jgi:predicted acyltransferase
LRLYLKPLHLTKIFPLNQRYYSLDVFRGATVALMVLVNNPGSWGHIYSPLEHAEWHGLTPTDLVFPFFLFAVGNAMAFVMPRLETGGDRVFWRKVIVRTLWIFGIGLFLQWWPFVRWSGDQLEFVPWTWTVEDKVTHVKTLMGIRILGVLARIALCYFFASIIVYYLKARGAFLAGLIILLIYWAICYVGNPDDPYSMTGWIGNKLDFAVLHSQHMYHGEGIAFDPEGILSTLPAIVQVIFGYLVGDYIIKKGKEHADTIKVDNQVQEAQIRSQAIYATLTGLFVAAVAFLLTAYVWSLSFPINKKIWTSSYVLATTGMATAILATMVFAIEVKGMRGWLTKFFTVFGKNALFIFALSAFLPRALRLIRIPNGVNDQNEPVFLSPWNWIYERVYKFIPGAPEVGSLVFALTVIAFMWLIAYWMDRKKIYIKV